MKDKKHKNKKLELTNIDSFNKHKTLIEDFILSIKYLTDSNYLTFEESSEAIKIMNTMSDREIENRKYNKNIYLHN
jgi:hypothetical protein